MRNTTTVASRWLPNIDIFSFSWRPLFGEEDSTQSESSSELPA